MRFIFGIIIAFVVIISAIILIFTRNGSDTTQQIVSDQQIELTDYADSSATARYTIEGEINGRESHNSVRISVSPTRRVIEILRGYSGQVLARQAFSNSRNAYDNFIYALRNAGFSTTQAADFESEKGVCPLGNRTIYQLVEDGDEILRLWSSSCRRSEGSFGGNTRTVRLLFEAQIPNHRELTRDVRL